MYDKLRKGLTRWEGKFLKEGGREGKEAVECLCRESRRRFLPRGKKISKWVQSNGGRPWERGPNKKKVL